jgi:hypothetical protein
MDMKLGHQFHGGPAGRRGVSLSGERAQRLRRCALTVALVVAGMLLWPAGDAVGQTPSDVDTFRVVDVSGVSPGDTFTFQFYFRNVDTIGAYAFRVRYNPSLIEPLVDTIVDPQDGDTTIEVFSTQLRGTAFEVFAGGLPSSGVMTFAAVDFDQNPSSYFLPGTGVSMTQQWRVLPTVTSAQTATIVFEDDPVDEQSFNNLTDYRARIFKRPVLVDGNVTITIGAGGDPPYIENCPSAPIVTGQEQLVQFAITATDPNGDDLSLQASNLPSGATFTPSNPVNGNTTVTGTFQWVPNTSQLGDFTVSFRATDSPDGNSSQFCNVTITVDEGITGSPPDVICQASSITVDQGQQVSFTVTATDDDNDSLTLSALNLPTGATFTPSNPIEGLGPLTGTFKWTPSFTQSGAFTVSFQALDTTGLTDVCNTTIFVEEVDVDQLFTTSAAGQRPQGGVSGTQAVVIPVDLVNSQPVYGIQFDFVYDPTVFTPTQVQPSDRLTGFEIFENLGEEPGRIRVVALDFDGAQVASGPTSVLFNIIGNIAPSVPPGVYDISFEDARESINPDPEAPSVPLSTTDGIVVVDNIGDANLDTRIDVADVVAVVNQILNNYEFTMRQFVAGDINDDDVLDIFDLQGIINLIFGLPPTVAPGDPGTDTPARIEFVYDAYDGEYGAYKLMADAPVDIAGAQVALTYDADAVGLAGPQTTVSSAGFDLTYRDDGLGYMLALLIDPDNESRIGSGMQELMRIPLLHTRDISNPAVRLREVKLAAPDAAKIQVAGDAPLPKSFALHQNYPNPFNPTTTIAFSIGEGVVGAIHARLDVYNVLGQRVTTLVDGYVEPGRHEYEWDGTDRSGRQVASGLYFYRLIAGRDAETKKMVLLK